MLLLVSHRTSLRRINHTPFSVACVTWKRIKHFKVFVLFSSACDLFLYSIFRTRTKLTAGSTTTTTTKEHQNDIREVDKLRKGKKYINIGISIFDLNLRECLMHDCSVSHPHTHIRKRARRHSRIAHSSFFIFSFPFGIAIIPTTSSSASKRNRTQEIRSRELRLFSFVFFLNMQSLIFLLKSFLVRF